MIHVIPLNDEKEHRHSIHCWCGPTYDSGKEAKSLFVHHAADLREAGEQLIGEGFDKKNWGVFENEDIF